MEREVSAVEAERAVLGALIQDGHLVCRIRDIIQPEDLFKKINGEVLGIIYQLADRGTPIDLVTTSAECSRLGILREAGGADAYFPKVLEACATAENIETYGQIVKEQAIRRKIKEEHSNLLNELEKESMEKVATRLQLMLSRVLATNGNLSYGSIRKAVSYFIDHLQAIQEGRITGKGIRPGIAALEKKMGRFFPGTLNVIGGRTGMGKSSLCIILTLKFALQGKAIGIFSPEMTMYEIMSRFLAIKSQVKLRKIIDPYPGIFSSEELDDIARATDELSRFRIFIEETPAISLASLKARAQRMVEKEHIDMIFVDHIGQMRAETKSRGTRREEITTIAQGLKSLAKDLKIPIFAVSQLNREPEGRQKLLNIDGQKKKFVGYPLISDLRESGDIEQEADLVLLLYRPASYPENEWDPEDLWLIIAKNRHGPTGECRLRWRGEFTEIFEKDDSTHGEIQ